MSANGRKPVVALVAHGVHDHGGMERSFSELIRRAHGDFRFIVFAAELDESLRPLVEWRRVRVPLRPIPLKLAVFAVSAGLKLRREHVDIVHTMGAIVPNRADLATVQFCSAGFRARVGSLAPPFSPIARRINTGLERLLAIALERICFRASRVRTLGAVSGGVAQELRRHYPGIEIALTPNGVDLERFSPQPIGRATVRSEIGAADEDVVAIFVGGDWHRKGLDVTIEAAAYARALGASRLRLLVVGKGDEARFRGIARRHGLEDAVCFVGARNDTERYYRAADIFVLPTLYETFSLVAHEAAASGLPVVATRVSGIDELLGDDDAGMLVDRTAASIGSALATLARDPALRRRLGEGARRRVSAFDWTRSVESVVAAYRRLGEAA